MRVNECLDQFRKSACPPFLRRAAHNGPLGRTLDEEAKTFRQLETFSTTGEVTDSETEMSLVADIFERFNDARVQLEVHYPGHIPLFDSDVTPC